ncbi:MAG: hypothetical protein HUK08_09865, partial [Bacteroidaceae bacterium]|nr:hypothetical protein [Bacteroidaceae bacterium]
MFNTQIASASQTIPKSQNITAAILLPLTLSFLSALVAFGVPLTLVIFFSAINNLLLYLACVIFFVVVFFVEELPVVFLAEVDEELLLLELLLVVFFVEVDEELFLLELLVVFFVEELLEVFLLDVFFSSESSETT